LSSTRKYTTVKLDDSVAQLLKEVRNRIVRSGIAPLEEIPVICPRCGNTISGLKITVEYWKCDKCGYEQKGISVGATGKFALGFIIGAGLMALLWWLSSRSRGKSEST